MRQTFLKNQIAVWVLFFFVGAGISFAENTKNILITGYWPPTNKMLTQFSTDKKLNPDGWKGANWENLGYNVYAFFPTFPAGPHKDPKGTGDFEVDYQDTSQDFWRITGEIRPVAILSFGRGRGPWEIEYNARNLRSTEWVGDYQEPRRPSSRPDSKNPAGFTRHSTLPVENIANAVNKAKLGVKAWVDKDGNPGGFLCEYMAYHVMWYQNQHSSKDDSYPCLAAGFIHVSNISEEKAREAFEITLRETIHHLKSLANKAQSGSLGLKAAEKLEIAGQKSH